jgi:hypothetical protein
MDAGKLDESPDRSQIFRQKAFPLDTMPGPWLMPDTHTSNFNFTTLARILNFSNVLNMTRFCEIISFDDCGAPEITIRPFNVQKTSAKCSF